MTGWVSAALLLSMPALPALADENKNVRNLPCGIYNQAARPYIEKDIDTQSTDRTAYTMETTTTKGKKLTVEVRNVLIRMQGERNHVSVFLDGKPLAKTSHQDVPLYLEVHVDDEKYRIICVRTDDDELVSEQSATAAERLETADR